MNPIRILPIIFVSFALLGCYEPRTVYVSSPSSPSAAYDLRPLLLEFHLIDSYGVDTEFDRRSALVLDPYYDAGLFEIDWRVDSPRSYRVDFRINDAPTLTGSRRVYSEVCGEGRQCDQEAVRLCQYYPDLTMACGWDESVTDIGHLIYTLPQKVYAILRVCDMSATYCEYDYYPVWVE
jgi:hypothetical protein